MTTFAWLSPSDSTAIILGFNKLVCIGFPFQYPRLVTPIRLTGDTPKINSRVNPLPSAIRVPRPLIRLTRIQFDDQAFVDIARNVSAIRHGFERAFELLGIDRHPARHSALLSQVQRFQNTHLLLRLFANSNHVACLDLHRRDVIDDAIHRDRLVADQLARFSARGAETHAVHDVIETRLKQLKKVFARRAFTAISFSEITAELTFKYAVNTLNFLFFAKLRAVVRRTSARRTTMLTRLAVEFAFVGERTTCALQEKISTFTAGQLGFRTGITCHFASLIIDHAKYDRASPTRWIERWA